MKKLNFVIALLALATVSFIAASCGSGASKDDTPAKIEMAIWEQIKKENYDKAFDMWFGTLEIAPDQNTAENKQVLREMFKKVESKVTEKGGIASVELVSENIAEDGNTAKVTTKCTYNDGSTDESNSKYVLVDGKWKTDMSK